MLKINGSEQHIRELAVKRTALGKLSALKGELPAAIINHAAGKPQHVWAVPYCCPDARASCQIIARAFNAHVGVYDVCRLGNTELLSNHSNANGIGHFGRVVKASAC